MNNKDFSQLHIGDKLRISPDFLGDHVKNEMEKNLTFKVVKARSDGYYVDNGEIVIEITPHDRWWIKYS